MLRPSSFGCLPSFCAWHLPKDCQNLIEEGPSHHFQTPFEIKKPYPPTLKDPKHSLLYSTMYKIVCSCGAPYKGETGRSFRTRFCEHSADIRYDRVHKSTLAEHSSSTKHHICLESAQILAKEDNFFKRKLKEAIEISYHSINLNRDDGWSISPSWQPLLSMLNNHHQP